MYTADYRTYTVVHESYLAVHAAYSTVYETYTKLYSWVYNIYCWVYGIYGYVHIVDYVSDIFCYIRTHIYPISYYASHDESYWRKILAQKGQVQKSSSQRSTKAAFLHPADRPTSRFYGTKDGELQQERYVVV